MMTNKDYLEDILFILQNICQSPEMAVKRWSSIPCDDYQLPLVRLMSFITYPDRGSLSIKEIAAHRIIVDIISHSHLAQILEYDARSGGVRFRAGFPVVLQTELRKFIAANTGAIEKVDT